MAGQTIQVTVLADTKKFSRAMQGLDKSSGLSRLGSSFETAGHKVTGFLGAATKATAAFGAVLAGYTLKKGFERLNALDQAKAKLTGLGNSAKQVDSIMSNALASVKGTAFGMDEAATVAAGAVAAGIKPGAQLTKTLKLTADAATIAGTSMGDMGSIFNKVATSNKVQGDTIAQLSDKGIPIVQLLSKTLGVSADQVVKLASAGKINFAQFQMAMQSGLGGAAQSSGKTFTGAMKNLQASLGRIGANLLAGVFPQIAPQVSKLTDAMAPLEDKAKVVGEALGKKLSVALKKLPTLIATVRDKWENLTLAWKTGINVDDGPLGVVEKAVAWLGVHLPPVVDKVKSFFSGLKSGDSGKQVGDVFSKLKNADLSGLGDSLKKCGTELGQFTKLGPVVNSGLSLAATAFGLLADHAGLVAKLLPVLVGGWVAYKVAQAANQTVGRQSVIGFWAQTAATIAHSIALRANASALRAQAAASAVSTTATEEGTVAQNTGLLTRIRATVAMIAQRVAAVAVAAAQRAMAAAQWLVNAAMEANPIGLVVLALAALAAGLVIAYNKSSTFRAIVNAAFGAVKNVVSGVVGWFRSSFVPFFTKTIPAAFQTVLNFVRSHWKLILSLITGPIGAAVILVASNWGKIRGVFNRAVSWAKGTFSSAWSAVKGILLAPVRGAKSLISTEISGVKRIFSGAKNAIGTIWSGIKSKITAPITSVLSWIGNHFVNPINSLLKKVGVGFRIPWPSFASGGPVANGGGHVAPDRGFARGGILPGFTPHSRGDDRLTPMRSGEGVIVSEALRDPRSRALIYAINRAALRGGSSLASMFAGQKGYSLGGIIGDIGGGIWSGVKKVGGFAIDIAKFLSNPASILRKFLGGISGNLWGQVAKGALGKVVGGVVDKVKGLFSGGGGGAEGGGNYAVAGGVKRWTGVARQAMAMAGLPGSYLSLLLHRMMVESGGNPAAINMWDSNAQAGHPSQGLMQTIPSTFAAYAGALRGRGILDPLANIYAAIKYTLARYGLGGIGRAWGGTAGYATGTRNAAGGWSWIGERGAELMKVPPGSQILSAKDSQRKVQDGGSALQPIHIEMNNVPMDNANSVAKELIYAMQRRGVGKFASA